MGRLDPFGAEPGDGLGGGHDEGRMGQHAEGVGQRAHEGDLQVLRVQGPDPDVLGPALALVVRAGALHAVADEVGVRGGGPGVQYAHPGVHEVLGGDGGAVGPSGRADVEGVGPLVGLEGPGVGERGDRQRGPGSIDHQAFEEGSADPPFGHARGQRRVQRLRFGAVAHDEILGESRQGRRQRQGKTGDLFHGTSPSPV